MQVFSEPVVALHVFRDSTCFANADVSDSAGRPSCALVFLADVLASDRGMVDHCDKTASNEVQGKEKSDERSDVIMSNTRGHCDCQGQHQREMYCDQNRKLFIVHNSVSDRTCAHFSGICSQALKECELTQLSTGEHLPHAAIIWSSEWGRLTKLKLVKG